MNEQRKPHKHAEMIKAWADGAIIQYRDSGNRWCDTADNQPCWDEYSEYRIKPESRFLNVYEYTQNCVAPSPIWYESLERAVREKSVRVCNSIGYLEDKQNGSVPVFYYWEE